MRAAPTDSPARRPRAGRLRRRPAPLPLGGDPLRVPPDDPPGSPDTPSRSEPSDSSGRSNPAAPPPAGGPPRAADVVVPVFGAAQALARCLSSLLAHTDLARHRLLLVLDGPQPPAVDEAVAAALGHAGDGGTPGAERRGVVVLAQPERQGFVAAVNRGMAESGRDVVLLNSDTQVTAGWLDKLQRAAYSAREIATVTPFSNTATICSLPRFLESNALPAGWSVDAFARLVEERSQAVYPRLPTGVGVCLYIKRKALSLLGPFDHRSFGLGYGEESEFCMRALKAGFAHVLDDATFIYHEGHRSFGASRHARVDAAHRRLASLHPEYMATVADFLRRDPLRPLRERIVAALAPPHPSGRSGRSGAPDRVLHVVHGWPPWNHAGTELYAAWLARRQAAHREVTVYSRIADPARTLGDALELLDGGARVRLLVRNFDERNPLSRNALASRPVERDFARLLAEARPQLVHVHHLAGHTARLPAMVRRRGIPLVFQLQDWWTPCARANLLDRDRRLCSGPGAGKCAACLPLTGLPPAPLLNRLLHRYRAAATRNALRGAAAYVAGSRCLRDTYRELGLLRPDDPVHVLDYGVALTAPAPRPPRPPGAPLRFGVIGSILPHKGIHVAVAAFAGVDPRRAQLTVWGDPTISPAYTRELEALGAALDGAAAGADASVDAAETGAAGGIGPSQAAGEAAGSEDSGRTTRTRGDGQAEPQEAGVQTDLSETEGGWIAAGNRPAWLPTGGAPAEHGEAAAAVLAGGFEESRKAEIFAAMDVLVIPSLGLESFGLVAREAMHHGVPVVASRRGALVELFPDEEGAGALFTAGDAADLRRLIDRLIANPGLLERWRQRLPAVKGADEHAEEIEELYLRILAGAAAPATAGGPP
jgi:glycosyltransferase involved in cell wall biosynthesis/GT2 family glycosyltransferase